MRDNAGNIPPRIHNIDWLWQATRLAPMQDQIDTANELNGYQLEGRYPDYLKQLLSVTTAAHATRLFNEAIALRSWLLNTLP